MASQSSSFKNQISFLKMAGQQRILLLALTTIVFQTVFVRAGLPSLPSTPVLPHISSIRRPLWKKRTENSDRDEKAVKPPKRKWFRRKNLGGDAPSSAPSPAPSPIFKKIQPFKGMRKQRGEKQKKEEREAKGRSKTKSSSSSSSSSKGKRPLSMTEALKQRQKEMGRDLETGLRWYCSTSEGRNESTNLTQSLGGRNICEPPVNAESYLQGNSLLRLRFVQRVCKDEASPIIESRLCRTFRSTERFLTIQRGAVKFLFTRFPKLAYQAMLLLYTNPLGSMARRSLERMARSFRGLFGLRQRVAVVRLEGPIVAGAGGAGGIDVASVDAIEAAFKSRPAAVFVELNSGGGSPVQSSLVYHRLMALRRRYQRIPLVVFVEDVAASGAFFIASAANEIVVDPSSVVGSVGVVAAGWGYTKVMKKYGVERRVMTSGANKWGAGDPYLDPTEGDLARQASTMATLHDEFIAAVVAGRGHKLNATLAHLLADAADSGGSRRASGTQPARRKSKSAAKACTTAAASTVATSAGHALYVHSSAAASPARPFLDHAARRIADAKKKKMLERERGTRRRRRRRYWTRSSSSSGRSKGSSSDGQRGVVGRVGDTFGDVCESVGSRLIGAVDTMCFWRNSTNYSSFLDDPLDGQNDSGDEDEDLLPAEDRWFTDIWAHDVEVSGTPEPYGGAAALKARAAKEASFRGDCLSGAALARRGLFDGSVYPGRVAVEVGFADQVGDLLGTARYRYGRNVELRRFALLRNAIGYRRVFQFQCSSNDGGVFGDGGGGAPGVLGLAMKRVMAPVGAMLHLFGRGASAALRPLTIAAALAVAEIRWPSSQQIVGVDSERGASESSASAPGSGSGAAGNVLLRSLLPSLPLLTLARVAILTSALSSFGARRGARQPWYDSQGPAHELFAFTSQQQEKTDSCYVSPRDRLLSLGFKERNHCRESVESGPAMLTFDVSSLPQYTYGPAAL